MFGPKISDPSKMDSREIPEIDVQAYKAAGWSVGHLPESAKAAKAENTEGADKPPAAPTAKKGKGTPKK